MFNKKLTVSFALTMMMVLMLSAISYAYPNNNSTVPYGYPGNDFNNMSRSRFDLSERDEYDKVNKFIGQYEAKISEKGRYTVDIKRTVTDRLEATIRMNVPEAGIDIYAFSFDITPINRNFVLDEISFTPQSISGLNTKEERVSFNFKINSFGDQLTVTSKQMVPSTIVLDRR
jgi:hypothetical protein